MVPVRIPADGGRCLGRAHSGVPHSPVLRTWEMQHAAHSPPRATRLFRVAEQARCWGPAAAGAEGNDRAGVFATVTVAANSAPGPLLAPHRRLDAASRLCSAERSTGLDSRRGNPTRVGCARRAERPAGVRCRSHRADAAGAACGPWGSAERSAPAPRCRSARAPGPPSAGLSLDWIVAVQFAALPLTPFRTVES